MSDLYTKANQLAVQASCTFVETVYQEIVTENTYPSSSTADVSMQVEEGQAPLCGISFICKRRQDKRWTAIEFPVIDPGTTITITINGTDYYATSADNAGGITAALIAFYDSDISGVYMEEETLSDGSKRLIVWGDFDTIAVTATGGTGTVLGKCDALAADVTLFGKIQGLGFWCRLPVIAKAINVYNDSDIYAVGIFTAITTVIDNVTKNGEVYGTGFSPCVLVVYNKASVS